MAEYVQTAEDREVTAQSTDDEALIKVARRRFQLSAEAEEELRREFLIDQRYRAGDQWPQGISQQRELDQRPSHVVNLFPAAIAQVTNAQRANRPALRVSPAGGAATVDVAQICDGLLRHIQRDSRAPIAYDVAAAEAAAIGRGWMRVLCEYEDPRSFNQKLTILSIPNALSVYPQPNLREPDYSDMNYCFIVEDVPHDEFLARYPGVEPQAFDAWAATVGDDWITRETVRVADYYYREYRTATIALLSGGELDGKVIDLEGAGMKALVSTLPPGVTIRQQRTTQISTVHWCKINGQQVLERTTWPGSWIPVIPVLGDMMYNNGKVRLSGIIRDARDPQSMVNYWESARTEAIALAPRAPYIGAEGQFEGHEHEWEQANRRNFAYLQYKMQDVRGTPVPPPQRQVQEPAIQALNYACESAKDNFHATTRIYPVSYGNLQHDRSGKAIEASDKNAELSNSHHTDNLGRALHHLGRVLLEPLPLVYNQPGRVQQIVNEDGTEKLVTMNQRHTDEETGIEQFYDLGAGHYAVEVQTGPAYATRRQESLAALTDLAKADPMLMQVADDLVVSQMDFPMARDIAARLKKSKPPEILADEQGKGADKDTQLAQASGQAKKFQQEAQALNAHAQQVEGQVQQLAQENQQLKAQAQSKAEDLQLKQEDLQLKAHLEADKLVLEQRKLDLDAQRLDLDRLKVEHELGLEQQAADTDQATAALTQQTQQVSLDAVTALQGQLAALQATMQATLQVLAETTAQRQQPRTITVHRDASGTLIGEVH